MIIAQALHWLALKRVYGVGGVLSKRLIEAFQTPDAVFSASEEALWAIDGISENVAKNILTFNGYDDVRREMEKIEKGGVTLLGLTDPDYPTLLGTVDDPPLVLYAKGTKIGSDLYPVAMVGTRNITSYGRSVAEQIAGGLAHAGMTVVSGFARGIDSVAHQSALASNGRTIAVMGCGIDRIYPPEHRKLYDQIIQQGVIFSEFPMGATPEPHHFPQRNRTISGLSLGCVVIEASQKSGALITARFALEQNREVFAVPGSIFSETSRGTHYLLQSGAKLVESVQDIINELIPQIEQKSVTPVVKPPAPVLSKEELALYGILSTEPKHIDRIIEEASLEPSHVSSRLLELELKGIIRQSVGQNYMRV